MSYEMDISQVQLLEVETLTTLLKEFEEFRDTDWSRAENAYATLMCSFQHLVARIARRYAHYFNAVVSLSDLVSEGSIALSKALYEYKSEKSLNFSKFAESIIQRWVARYCYEQRTGIKIPFKTARAARRMRKQIRVLVQELGCMPTNDEIADHFGMSVARVRQLQDYYMFHHMPSLDVETQSGEEYLNIIAWHDPSEEDVQDVRIDTIVHEMRHLSEIERDVLKMYFGFGGKMYSFEEIGKKYDVMYERVRQIKERALARLKDRLHFRAEVEKRLDLT